MLEVASRSPDYMHAPRSALVIFKVNLITNLAVQHTGWNYE